MPKLPSLADPMFRLWYNVLISKPHDGLVTSHMARTVRTSLFPAFPDKIAEDILVVTLGSAAPRGLKAVPRSLHSIAMEILARNGIAVVPRVHGRHLLKQAIFRAAPDADLRSLTSRTRRSLDVALRTGIDPETLIRTGSPRVRQLGRIADEYRNALRRKRLIDSAEMLLTASSHVSEKKKILVYGHFRARKEELTLIDALAGDGSVYYLPSGDDPIFTVNRAAVDELAKRGWEIDAGDAGDDNAAIGRRAAARFGNLTSERVPVTAHSFSDIDKEVRSTLAAVKQIVRAGSSHRDIAVIARDLNKYSRPISVVADEYGLAVETEHSIPLETTGLGGFMGVLLEAIERGFSFESTARLILHPFGPGMADRHIAEARRKRTSGLSQWLEFCPDLAVLEDHAERPLTSWIEFLRNAAQTLGLRKRAVGQTTEWLAYETLFEALRTTAGLEPGRTISFEGFAAIISEILSEESVPSRPRRGGVRVMRPEDAVGKTFDHVFIMGLAEGIFPKPPGEDPVIDLHERRKLRDEHNVHFASAADLAHWEDLSFFFTLLSAQKQLVLSYPKVIDNAELVAGAFFGRLGIEGEKLEVKREAEYASSVEEVRRFTLRQPVLAFDKVLESARKRYHVEFKRETASLYDEFDGVIGVPIDPSRRNWSASQVTMIGQCAFRWFAGRLLRLSAIEEMETGLDPGTRGRLYHKALELAVARSLDAVDVRSATLANLDAAFADAELDEEVRLPRLPNWDVERREQLRELRKAVESPEFISPDARVVGVEREFQAEWEGFRLRGKIDRIDETPEGLIAIDYKTGGQPPRGAKDAAGKLSVDVQIPIYSRVALPKLFPDGNVGTSVYYSLTKGKVLRSEQEGDMERLRSLAGFLRSILGEGSFAVDPDVQEKACTYCDFATVCRKGPRIKRKRRAE